MNRGLLLSFILHAAAFLIVLLGPPPQAFEWDRAEAVAVDLVSMPVVEPPPDPVKTPEAPPSLPDTPQPDVTPVPDPPADPDPEPEPVDEVKPEPVQKAEPPKPKRVFKKYAPPKEDDQPSLAERLQQRLQTDDEPSETPADAAPSTPVPEDVPVGDEVVAVPTAASAEVQAVDFPFQWYLNVLRTKITAAWDPPGQRLLRTSRVVVVEFRVYRDGRITDVVVRDASGTPGLDTSARTAIERGGPYPPLPENYENDFLDVAVRFTVEG